MKKFVLIVAGGSGLRMNNNIPKQFIEIQHRPLLMHTFDVFWNFDPEIEFILVLPENQVDYWKSLCVANNFNVKHKLAIGGETRFHSVKNGLDLIKEEGVVFIHDGVRPLVSHQTIRNCYRAACDYGNALPVIQIDESVRIVEEKVNKAVDRSRYVLVQTPQTFKCSLIKKAYQQEYKSEFTDDASVLENNKHIIHLVEGNRENIKITYQEDLLVARSFLSPQ